MSTRDGTESANLAYGMHLAVGEVQHLYYHIICNLQQESVFLCVGVAGIAGTAEQARRSEDETPCVSPK